MLHCSSCESMVDQSSWDASAAGSWDWWTRCIISSALHTLSWFLRWWLFVLTIGSAVLMPVCMLTMLACLGCTCLCITCVTCPLSLGACPGHNCWTLTIFWYQLSPPPLSSAQPGSSGLIRSDCFTGWWWGSPGQHCSQHQRSLLQLIWWVTRVQCDIKFISRERRQLHQSERSIAGGLLGNQATSTNADLDQTNINIVSNSASITSSLVWVYQMLSKVSSVDIS